MAKVPGQRCMCAYRLFGLSHCSATECLGERMTALLDAVARRPPQPENDENGRYAHRV
jgi:hypothetical protein